MEQTTAPQPKKSQKLPKLTKKQRGFVSDYVLSGNGQEAALKNYDIDSKDPGNVARAIASENLTKPNIIEAVLVKQETLKSALEKQGITPEKIAIKIDSLLDSNDGNLVDKGLKHATNIYGIEDPSERPQHTNTYNFIFNAENQADIKKIEDNIKARLTEKHESNQTN